MKNDTKLALIFIIWFPFFLAGMLCGIICRGFGTGFETRKLLDDWFRKSEILSKDAK